ncbi:MAG TPA: DUF998 domain-containing protein [Ktedonobacterales bacterium]|jgi:hypothetical protein|nr:DUF998 domain-containing protein [Ktedonobacterales bacterium]
MATPSAHPPLANTIASTAASPSQLDGAFLSPTGLILIACGTFGGILFAAVYLVEGATRPGYDAREQAISALSLGPGGWVQQVNFIIFGALAFASAFGWRIALKPGTSVMWYPILKGITGIGLVIDGFFSQDPAAGYPVGAIVGAPTAHGIVHNLFAFVAITALAVSSFVLARRSSRRYAASSMWSSSRFSAPQTGTWECLPDSSSDWPLASTASWVSRSSCGCYWIDAIRCSSRPHACLTDAQ